MTIRSLALCLPLMLIGCSSSSDDSQSPTTDSDPAAVAPTESGAEIGGVRLTLTSLQLLGEAQRDQGFDPGAGRRFVVLGARIDNGSNDAVAVRNDAFAVVTTYGGLDLIEHGPSRKRDLDCERGVNVLPTASVNCSLVFEVGAFDERHADAKGLMFRLGEGRLDVELPHDKLALNP